MEEYRTGDLDGSKIKKSAGNRITDVVVLGKVTSTNDVLKSMCEKVGVSGLVVVADEQTAGKGRLGRSFYSPSGTGIYLSTLIVTEYDDPRFKALTPLTAVAVSEAIEAVCNVKTKIKWVNDVYAKGGKCAGILTETFSSDNGLNVVIGIGVNVGEPMGGFPDDIKNRACALTDKPTERNALIGRILKNLYAEYDGFDKKSLVERYSARCMHLGSVVTVVRNGAEREAYCEGIDEDFCLAVRYADGSTERLFTGEITLKI